MKRGRKGGRAWGHRDSLRDSCDRLIRTPSPLVLRGVALHALTKLPLSAK
jgi:hypothetical protein